MGLPYGYRIERHEQASRLRDPREPYLSEVRFALVETASGDVVTAPAARYDRHYGCWVVVPGSTTSKIGADEARARAAALVSAAAEVAFRNGEED